MACGLIYYHIAVNYLLFNVCVIPNDASRRQILNPTDALPLSGKECFL